MQIGEVGGLGAARIDGDNRDFVGVAEFALFDPFEDDRMAVRGVGADQEETIGKIDIGVGRRRAIGTERSLVTDAGRSHAQTRIGIEVIGAEETLRKFVSDVIFLRCQLPGARKTPPRRVHIDR